MVLRFYFFINNGSKDDLVYAGALAAHLSLCKNTCNKQATSVQQPPAPGGPARAARLTPGSLHRACLDLTKKT